MYLGSVLCIMPSAIDLAKRALVSLLRTLAATYRVALTLQRDAPLNRGARAVARECKINAACGSSLWELAHSGL